MTFVGLLVNCHFFPGLLDLDVQFSYLYLEGVDFSLMFDDDRLAGNERFVGSLYGDLFFDGDVFLIDLNLQFSALSVLLDFALSELRRESLHTSCALSVLISDLEELDSLISVDNGDSFRQLSNVSDLNGDFLTF